LAHAEGSELAPFDPVIYAQGSFALGTAVRPMGEGDYDVDAVCVLQLSSADTTPAKLKRLIGERLRANETYVRLLEPEGRRCWTLKYADASRFHLDILPAIPDSPEGHVLNGVPIELAKHAICITDRAASQDLEWPRSNPKGYLEWFKSRMQVRFDERRIVIAGEKRAEVQNVPEYEVRTPLQRVVQLLKRHRDQHLGKDPDRPISIIITTLAASAYRNEADIVDALLNMIPKMRNFIRPVDGVVYVPNPVNPQENFADKWQEEPRKAQVFEQWLTSIEAFHNRLLQSRDLVKSAEFLGAEYGDEARQAFDRASSGRRRQYLTTVHSDAPAAIPSALPARHREQPKWPVDESYRVKIKARASRDGFRTIDYRPGQERLRKGFALDFTATTNVPRHFDVYWQVVNTGDEAAAEDGLRGGFQTSGEKLTCHETTKYQGTHSMQCFIVKDGTCVARSPELLVQIA
jgi:hypothetical protein